MAVFGTLMLGNNEIQNCDTALVVEGEEVFRLRERQHDGQLHVVFCVADVEPRSRPGRYKMVQKSTGNAVERTL